MGVVARMLFNKLPGAPGKARSWSGRVTQQTADDAKRRAQELVPVDTSETRDHIEVIVQGPFTRALVSTRPSTDGKFDVPTYLEYNVKSYIRAALEEQRGPFFDKVDKIIEAIV